MAGNSGIFSGLAGRIGGRRGQVAIILIIVVALALVFYAVVMNLGKVSSAKTIITVASNSGASIMASQMASYGQKLYKEEMGGKFKECSTNWLPFLAIIVAIIVVILTWGAALPVMVMAIMGLVMQVVSLALQVTVIQPGITDMWNKISSDLSSVDYFVETGVQTALFKAVNDYSLVQDIYDLDGDGLYGEGEDYVGRLAAYYDRRARMELLMRDPKFVEDFSDGLEEFLYDNPFGLADEDENRDFWALTSPAENEETENEDGEMVNEGDCVYHVTDNPLVPSICNPCCLPTKVRNESYNPDAPSCDATNSTEYNVNDTECQEFISMVPGDCDCYTNGTCDDPEDEIGTVTTCADNTLNPYVLGDPVNAYIYDPYHQAKSQTEVRSFLEWFGQDDGHEYYYSPPRFPEAEDQVAPENSADEEDVSIYEFSLEDNQVSSEGAAFFTADDATGIFPYLHHITYWGVDLRSLDPSASNREHCYWYDQAQGYDYYCDPAGYPYLARDIQEKPLLLPLDPEKLLYQKNRYVDSRDDNVSGNPPLAVDAVIAPDDQSAPSLTILAPPDTCPYADQSQGYWKKGADRYCSPGDLADGQAVWPYNSSCPKHYTSGDFYTHGTKCFTPGGVSSEPDIEVDCDCVEVPADKKELWHDDALDEIDTGLREFTGLAEAFLYETDFRALADTFESWYVDFATWIERKDLTAEGCPASEKWCNEKCYHCGEQLKGIDAAGGGEPRWGLLQELALRAHKFINRLEEYGETSFVSNNAWCVPESGSSEYNKAPAEEQTLFSDAEGYGRMGNVRACLDYNVEGYDWNGVLAEDNEGNKVVGVNSWGTNMGNDYRFRKCGETCSTAYCSKLPRSLVPGYDPRSFNVLGYTDPDKVVEDTQRFDFCLDQCSVETCFSADTDPLPAGPEPYPAYFDENEDCRFVDLPDGTTRSLLDTESAWYAPVTANQAAAALKSDNDKTVERHMKCLDNCSAENCAINTGGGDSGLPESGFSSAKVKFEYPLGQGEFDENSICKWEEYLGDPVRTCDSGWQDCMYNCGQSLCKPILQAGGQIDCYEACSPRCDSQYCGFVSPILYRLTTDFRSDNQGAWREAMQNNIDISNEYEYDPDIYQNKFQDCYNTCSNATCKLVRHGGPIQEYHPFDESKCCQPEKWGFYSSNPDKAGACHRYWTAVKDAMKESDGNASCDLGPCDPWVHNDDGVVEPNPYCDITSIPQNEQTGWLFQTRVSALEARNQVAKFRRRRDFLQKIDGERVDAINALTYGRDGITDFLTGPAQDLIKKRKEIEEEEETGYPKRVIYGWRSDPPPSRQNLEEGNYLRGKGYWHIVKVEAGIPQKCIGDCSTGPDGENPGALWPKVVTYTRGALGSTRCYEIKYRTGIVKLKVTRWDEDADQSALTFPNRTPVWNSRGHHPQRGAAGVPEDEAPPSGTISEWIESKCPPMSDHEGQTISGIYRGAFMVNKPEDYMYVDKDGNAGSLSVKNEECWTQAELILEKGMISSTCAQYFGHEGQSAGFSLKFIDCLGAQLF
jgi:hypothetical protein